MKVIKKSQSFEAEPILRDKPLPKGVIEVIERVVGETEYYYLSITTKHGKMTVNYGDWIVYYPDGSYGYIKADYFKNNYETYQEKKDAIERAYHKGFEDGKKSQKGE